MMSFNCRVILNCIMTLLTLCCLETTILVNFVLSSVVSIHLLMALGVLCSLCGFNIYLIEVNEMCLPDRGK